MRSLCPILTISSRCWRRLPPEFTKQYVAKISPRSLERYRQLDPKTCSLLGTDPSSDPSKPSSRELQQSMKRLYPETVPHNLDPRYRDPLRERLERQEMMLRRKQLQIPEFYVGSILAVSVSDAFAPDASHRFVGLCIQRCNQGLWTHFTLRNVVEKTAVEIRYELYNPTVRSIEVLLLEKRLDDNLLYLRDAALEDSRVPFDMTPVPHLGANAPVPVNTKKIKLLPRPWKCQWHLHGYRGIDDSMYDQLSDKELDEIDDKVNLLRRYDLMEMYRLNYGLVRGNVSGTFTATAVLTIRCASDKGLDEIDDKVKLLLRYDLMEMYRSRANLDDQSRALTYVHLQYQDFIKFHESRRNNQAGNQSTDVAGYLTTADRGG